MNASSFLDMVGRGLTASFVTALTLFNLTSSANASNILLGSDYLATPDDGHTSFDFGSLGIVKFKGVPLPGLQGADTIIQRLSNAIFDRNNDGIVDFKKVTIPIQMSALSLVSSSPVFIQGDYFNVVPKLNSKPSAGTMSITHNTIRTPSGLMAFNDSGSVQGTFSSLFNVNFDAVFTSVSSGKSFVIPNQSISLINSGANWSHAPSGSQSFLKRGSVPDQAANCHQRSGSCHPGDFFPGPVQHAKGSPGYPNGHGTTVAQILKNDPVCTPKATRLICDKVELIPLDNPEVNLRQTPAPLAFLGAATSLGFCRTLRKRTKAHLTTLN
ncbi:MAG: hypothetical protein ACKO45_02450 [Cyanobium sp.]